VSKFKSLPLVYSFARSSTVVGSSIAHKY
jgi:hypothetical protein